MGREWVFRTKGFVISHPAAGTCKNGCEKRERVGMERMRKKAVSRETCGFVNSAVISISDATTLEEPSLIYLKDERQFFGLYFQ